MKFDFVALADAVRRNNRGVGGCRGQAEVSVKGNQARVVKSGQTFPVVPGTTASGARWSTLEILQWSEPEKTTVRILPPAAAEQPAEVDPRD